MCYRWSPYLFLLGLCDWLQLASSEYGADADVCGDADDADGLIHAVTECCCILSWLHRGPAESHSGLSRVHPNTDSRYRKWKWNHIIVLLFFITVAAFFWLLLLFCISGKRAAFNWLTGSSVDTLADYPLQTSSESVSSLLVFEKRDRTRMTRKTPGADFGTKRLTALDDKGNDQSAKGQHQQTGLMAQRFHKAHASTCTHGVRTGLFNSGPRFGS